EYHGACMLQHRGRCDGLTADFVEWDISRVKLESLLASARIMQARAEGGNRVEIHNQHVFCKLFSPRDQITLSVEDHASPIVNYFVLAANQVEIRHNDAIIGGARSQHLLAKMCLASVER